jgi:hypothetical protein
MRHCTDWPNITDCGDDGIPGRITVREAGTYRIAYRVATLAPTTNAKIELAAGGRTYTTAVATGGPWQTVTGPADVWLPTGTQNIRISPPADAGSWYLNWFTLTRA